MLPGAEGTPWIFTGKLNGDNVETSECFFYEEGSVMAATIDEEY